MGNVLHGLLSRKRDEGAKPALVAGSGYGEQTYTFTNVDGKFTVLQLVEMMENGDEKMKRIRKRELPPEFWVLRRSRRNKRRSKRQAARKKERRRTAATDSLSIDGDKKDSQGELSNSNKGLKQLHKERRQALIEGTRGMSIYVECTLSQDRREKEIRSLVRQLQYCLAANRRAVYPARLVFTGFKGAVKQFAEDFMGATSWKAQLCEETVGEALSVHASEYEIPVIVLSPDAEEALSTVDEDTVYVVGGLVDRTVKKGITAKLAADNGWIARRLPLQEHFGHSAVLNVNDVVAILLLVHGGSEWEDALKTAIPQRRQAQARQLPPEKNVTNDRYWADCKLDYSKEPTLNQTVDV
jgi:tRNA (guanine9-N1)-methyltransferase